MTPTTVAVDGATLAVTDHQGDGPDLLMLHGLGLSQRSLGRLVEAMRPHHRVVAIDMRGHGGSSDVPWTLDATVDDVAAVSEALGLSSPLVLGHSLGGMVAMRCAGVPGLTSGAVNLDGWGSGRADQYLDADPRAVAAFLKDARGGVPSQGVARLSVTVMRRSAAGRRRIALAVQVAEELLALDVLALHRDIVVPALAFNAVAPLPRLQQALMGPGTGALLSAYRRGLTRDLAALAAEQSLLTVHQIDATHALVATHAPEVASAVTAWAALTASP